MKLVHVLYFITIGMFSIGLVACGASEAENNKTETTDSTNEKQEAYNSAMNYIHVFYNQRLPNDTIKYEHFENSIVEKRNDGYYYITSTFNANDDDGPETYEYNMLLDGNYDILNATIHTSVGIFDTPTAYEALSHSDITNIFRNGPRTKIDVDKKSETTEETEPNTTTDKDKDESTYEPEYMDQEEWETCVNSSAYSVEECKDFDKYYAHGEGQNEPGQPHEVDVNDRFGFSVEYPDNFTADSIPDNNGGITVHDDNATLTVFGTHGWSSTNGDYVTILEVDSIEAIYEQEIADLEGTGLEVSYKSMKDNWYVISYTNGSHIVYQKSIMASDFLATLMIEYPESVQEKYAPIVEHATETFSIDN